MKNDSDTFGTDPALWDVFISHAFEDKEVLVRPLATLLSQYGLRVWYDEFSLRLGDRMRASLDKGLRDSRFGVVVLSSAFFEKRWTNFELDSLVQRETPGSKVVLPLWFGVDVDDVKKFSLNLADKVAYRVDSEPAKLHDAALQIIKIVRPDLYGRIARRRALADVDNSIVKHGFRLKDIEVVRVPDGPVYQEELGEDLLGRIRLVRSCLQAVHTLKQEEWIHNFQREPNPYAEMRIWEYIAAVYMEVTQEFPLKPRHRWAVYAITLESTAFEDDLTERHAPLWKALPPKVRAFLRERMTETQATPLPLTFKE